ncbi:hypothetical protein MJO29_013694 [Puccinia striiformis f. sp. tritici]|nr:hypothetical protein MJO29_013694 [Puccinia striiformis f. sp. tritici]KAI9613172.1 hypothetical protein H4Q26_010451 [Puccinia striiformis f. sp. tritici PST-130]
MPEIHEKDVIIEIKIENHIGLKKEENELENQKWGQRKIKVVENANGKGKGILNKVINPDLVIQRLLGMMNIIMRDIVIEV